MGSTSTPAVLLSCNNSVQVVHSHTTHTLSRSSIYLVVTLCGWEGGNLVSSGKMAAYHEVWQKQCRRESRKGVQPNSKQPLLLFSSFTCCLAAKEIVNAIYRICYAQSAKLPISWTGQSCCPVHDMGSFTDITGTNPYSWTLTNPQGDIILNKCYNT